MQPPPESVVSFDAPCENVFTSKPEWLGGEASFSARASMAAPACVRGEACCRCCFAGVFGGAEVVVWQVNFVYDIHMSERLLRGVPVTDEQIQAWADEAERGYDLAELPAPRPGRPPVGKGPGVAVTVRLDAQTLAALMERAALEGIGSRSEAIRAAVREWTHIA